MRDTSLIAIERNPAPVRFFAILLVVFLGVTLAWAVAARKLAAVHFSPTRLTASDANLGALVKYAAAERKDVVWVGSSLTAALSERYFTIPNSYNLGLSGGSPVTALEIVERLPSPPEVVIVETNILDRPVDQTLLDRPWDRFDEPVVSLLWNFYRPLHLIPAAIFYSPEKIRAAAATRRQNLLEEPSTYRGLPDGARKELASLDGRLVRHDLEATNAARLIDAKDRLRERGVEVYFIHLPYAPEFQAHSYSTRAQSLISGNSTYVCDVCVDLPFLVPISQLGWVDGQHLNERSSVLVIDAVEGLLRSRKKASYKIP